MMEAFFIIIFVLFPLMFLFNNLIAKPVARRLAEKKRWRWGGHR